VGRCSQTRKGSVRGWPARSLRTLVDGPIFIRVLGKFDPCPRSWPWGRYIALDQTLPCSFASEEVAAKVLNIKGELGNPQGNNIGNNQVADKE